MTSTPSRTPASERNRSTGYAAPVHSPSDGTPPTVVAPSSSRSVARTPDQRGHRVGRRAAVIPECTGPASVRTVTSTLPVPRRLVVTVGTPSLDVAGVRDDDDVGGEELGLRGDEPLQAAGRHLLRALAHDDQRTPARRRRVAQRAERGEVHDEVALAVRRPPRVPAAVPLGERPRVAGPRVLVPRRLDVVVRVEQNRWRAGRTGGPTDDDDAAVVGVEEPDVVDAQLAVEPSTSSAAARARRDGLAPRSPPTGSPRAARGRREPAP